MFASKARANQSEESYRPVRFSIWVGSDLACKHYTRLLCLLAPLVLAYLPVTFVTKKKIKSAYAVAKVGWPVCSSQ